MRNPVISWTAPQAEDLTLLHHWTERALCGTANLAAQCPLWV